jgi:ATP-dependent Clp protease adaptor protein ClpS
MVVSILCALSCVSGLFSETRTLILCARPSRTAKVVLIADNLHMMADKDKPEDETGVLTDTKPKTQRPPMYKVMLLNDDYTPMEFVVHVLERFFGMSHAQAFELMLTVHKKGLAVVGVFSFEVAETKVAQVMDFARRHQHPLQCTMEKE